jgi:hypothetical protein
MAATIFDAADIGDVSGLKELLTSVADVNMVDQVWLSLAIY